ncbi:DUF5710 domain-containing protein [Paraburkholderia fungorum]|jgi:hypothetical protein|uniref:DUF5710 domain-containing protein n=1 Tax=Paraburkholderia fungorum TaxID=134537 RepID=UPI00351F4ECD
MIGLRHILRKFWPACRKEPPPGLPDARRADSQVKFYLTVPFREKDRVKELGAKWDSVAKQWFIPGSVDPILFKPWLIGDFHRPTLPVSFPPMDLRSGRPNQREILVSYCERHGFVAEFNRSVGRNYNPVCRCSIWHIVLGVPKSERELEVFRARLRKFNRNTRNPNKIVAFLDRVLAETWPPNFGYHSSRSGRLQSEQWQYHLDETGTDLSNALYDQRL